MCCGCCARLHRHQIHLISYGCVSFTLIATGLVFTIFAIFQKDSQIGKVWLAGPTTMVVGLVLCGKVIIDWGPAMMHGREGSIDSFDQLNLPANSLMINGYEVGNGNLLKAPLPYDNSLLIAQKTPYLMPQHAFTNGGLANSKKSTMVDAGGNVGLLMPPSPMSLSPSTPPVKNSDVGRNGAIDCIVYGPFDATTATNTPSRQSQTSHGNDGTISKRSDVSNNNDVFNEIRVDKNTNDNRLDSYECKTSRNSNYSNETISAINRIPPPFPLTLPISQTSLQTIPNCTSSITTVTTSTQTCDSSAAEREPACHCSNSNEYYRIAENTHFCTYCGKADDELTALEPPRVNIMSLHNSCNGRIGSMRTRRLSSSTPTSLNPSRQSMPTSWSHADESEKRQRFFTDDLSYNNMALSAPPYTAPLRVLIATRNETRQLSANSGLLYQGETFVLNERNFFI